MTNNTSFETADRGTHLKIVVVSLVASIAVMAVAITASTDWSASSDLQARGPVVKAGQPVAVSRDNSVVIR